MSFLKRHKNKRGYYFLDLHGRHACSKMKTDIGEYIVGAYLKIINGCNFIDYNVRPPGGGREGLTELDVVGLDFKNKIAYLCEVTAVQISKN